MSFNGTTNNVRISDDPTLRITDAITVMAWVKGEAQNARYFLSKYETEGDNRAWAMLTGTTGYTDKLRIIISNDGRHHVETNKRYMSSITAFDNTWHHVAFTFTNNTLKLYVDGAEDLNPVKYPDAEVLNLYESPVDVTIGSFLRNDAPDSLFKGQIDDARIYAEVLTSEKINTLYAETKHKYIAENNNKEK